MPEDEVWMPVFGMQVGMVTGIANGIGRTG